MSKGNSVQDDEGTLLVGIICAHRAEDRSWNLLPLFFFCRLFSFMQFYTGLNQYRIYSAKTSMKCIFLKI